VNLAKPWRTQLRACTDVSTRGQEAAYQPGTPIEAVAGLQTQIESRQEVIEFSNIAGPCVLLEQPYAGPLQQPSGRLAVWRKPGPYAAHKEIDILPALSKRRKIQSPLGQAIVEIPSE